MHIDLFLKLHNAIYFDANNLKKHGSQADPVDKGLGKDAPSFMYS